MSNEQIKTRLKSYFQSGDVPTESQFGELIDEAITSDAARLTEGKLAIDRLPKALDLNTVSGEGEATLAAKNIRADALEVNALNTRDITSTTMNTTTLNSRDVVATTVQSDSANLTTLQSASVSATDIATGTLNADSFITDNISVGGAITAVSVEAKLKGDGAEIQNLNPDAITGKVKSEKLYKGTKSALGVMQFATQEDIDSGTDNRAVTPKSMNQSIQHSVSQSETDTRTQLRSELSQSETELRSELSQSETRTDGKIQEVAAESKAYTDTHIQTLRTGSEDYTNGKIQTATDQNKAYIDGEIALLQAGIKFKKGVATVISEPLDLASGAPFPEVDGYQIVEGDRVLFTQQDDPKQNRVYMASGENTWLLAEDFDAKPEFELFVGLSLEVMQGNDLRQSIWSVTDLQHPEAPELTWQKRNDINNYEAGEGIHIEGRTISLADNWFTNNLEGETVKASSIVGVLGTANLPLDDIESGMSFVDEAGKIKTDSLHLDQIKPNLQDASESQKGVAAFASAEEALAGEVANKAITPATLNEVLNKRLKSPTPKKNILNTSQSVVSYESAGTISTQFLYSDYATTRNGTHLFISKLHSNAQINVHQWNGSFTLLENINNGGTYTYPRLANWQGEVVLYAGQYCYWFNESTRRFENKGKVTVNGSSIGVHANTKYGVCFDGKNRVAVLNSHSDTKLYVVEDPKNPQQLSNPITIPFPTDGSSSVFTYTGALKGFSIDASEEYGVLAYAQSFWQDPVLVSRLAPGATSFQTVFSAISPASNSHGGNALVYQESAMALLGNNAASSFGRMDSGTYHNLGSYSGGLNGAELPVFGLNETFYAVLPTSSNSLIYKVADTSASLALTIPGASNNSQSLGLAIFDGEIYLVNGESRAVSKLKLG